MKQCRQMDRGQERVIKNGNQRNAREIILNEDKRIHAQYLRNEYLAGHEILMHLKKGTGANRATENVIQQTWIYSLKEKEEEIYESIEKDASGKSAKDSKTSRP